jgi:hypothetical protein
MANWIAVGICAGLAAAVLQAAVLYPSPVTMVAFYLSALPIFVAALGWGLSASALAGLTGCLAILTVAGAKPALAFLIGVAVPPAILSWLALRSRPADEAPPSEGEPQLNGRQWYPEGRLVLWAALLTAGLTSFAILFVAPSAESFREMLEDLVAQMLAAMGEQSEIGPDQVDQMVSFMTMLLPIAAASIWLIATLVNMKLGARLVAAFNRSPRPWARFGALTLPRRAVWLLPLALAASMLPDMLGLIGSVFAAAVFTAFALAGLAVLHGLTEGMTARGPLLAGLYLALILLHWLLLVPLAVLTLIDMAFAMRARTAANPPANRE